MTGTESWALTPELKKKMKACENRWLLRLLQISYERKITNKETGERTRKNKR